MCDDVVEKISHSCAERLVIVVRIGSRQTRSSSKDDKKNQLDGCEPGH
jgi:hypothetical protein